DGAQGDDLGGVLVRAGQLVVRHRRVIGPANGDRDGGHVGVEVAVAGLIGEAIRAVVVGGRGVDHRGRTRAAATARGARGRGDGAQRAVAWTAHDAEAKAG